MTHRTIVKRRLGSASAAAVLALGAGLLTAAPAHAGPNGTTWPSAVEFVNHESGKCLEVADWRTDDGAPVRQWTCTGGDNQKWQVTDGLVVNIHSGKCLEIPGWSTGLATQAGQWDCHGGDNQRWIAYLRSNSGSRIIVNKHSNLVIGVADASHDDGAPIVQWPSLSPQHLPSAHQAWNPSPFPGLGG
ncbi:RICIN domain-containing protein [Kitasatospora sp. NPDC001574]